MKKKIALITAASLFIIAAATFFVYSNNQKAEYCSINVRYEKAIKSYLKDNVLDIDISDTSDYKGLSFLDSRLKSNNVFLCGEGHATAKNQEIQLYLLKYFNQKGNVRYLLTEEGYGSAYLINKYLRTGDKAYLEIVFSQLKGTFGWNKESYNFLLELFKYNNQLPEDKKITVLGADIEHQTRTGYIALNELLPKEKAPDSISKNIEYLRNNCKNDNLEKSSFATELSKDVDINVKDYKAYLKDNFFDFEFIVNNISNRDKCYNKEGMDWMFREDCIRKNFEKIYSHFPKGKYFGQWGSDHTYLSDRGGPGKIDNCFATYLNSDFEPTKGRVTSIAYFYKDSKVMSKEGNGEEKVNEVSKVGILAEESKGDYTLIRFDGEGTPFGNKPFFVSYPLEGGTKDYYQFGILIKNSPATRPYVE